MNERLSIVAGWLRVVLLIAFTIALALTAAQAIERGYTQAISDYNLWEHRR